ncbi:MAG: zinc ribbon domain-containing protein [Candidatus Hodarchaeota archaeon]
MKNDLGKKIWKSDLNPYYKRNKYIFFTLVIVILILPLIMFPISILADMFWSPFFYILIYSVCLPLVLLFLILGFTFSRKYLVIYQQGIKFKTNPINPFSKKKILRFNQIKEINIEHETPRIYKNRISKFLFYDTDSSSLLKTTGDYNTLSILTNTNELLKIRESFITDLENTKKLILKQKSEVKEIQPQIIVKEVSKKAVGKLAKSKIKKPKKAIAIPVDGNYCKFCGTQLSGSKIFCIKCGKKVSDDLEIKFCKFCGTILSGSREFCIKCGKKVN